MHHEAAAEAAAMAQARPEDIALMRRTIALAAASRARGAPPLQRFWLGRAAAFCPKR